MNTPALDITDLCLSIDGTAILESVSLRVEAGDFLGIIGPNGAGKSMLLQCVLGLITPTCGTIRIFGKTPQESRGQIAYVPQHPSFDLHYPIRVREVVLMGRMNRSTFLRSWKAEDHARVADALKKVRMTELADRQIGELSIGQVQRVLIARALAVGASLLLLDEPTSSLDPGVGGELYELLESLQPQATIILVSHELTVMSQYVKSVACLNRKLHYHASKKITREMIEETYGDSIDFVMHRHIHRILEDPPDRKPDHA